MTIIIIGTWNTKHEGEKTEREITRTKKKSSLNHQTSFAATIETNL